MQRGDPGQNRPARFWLLFLAGMVASAVATRRAASQDSLTIDRAEAAARGQYFAWRLDAAGKVGDELKGSTANIFRVAWLGQYGQLQAWEVSAPAVGHPIAPFTVGFVNGDLLRLAQFPSPELTRAWRAILPPSLTRLEQVPDSLLTATATRLARLAISRGESAVLADACASHPEIQQCKVCDSNLALDAANADTTFRGPDHAAIRISLLSPASGMFGEVTVPFTFLFVVDSAAELAGWARTNWEPCR